MSKLPKRSKERQFNSIGDHQQFLQRITKTLYYGKLPATERLSLPVTELAAELFSEAQRGRSLDRLHCNEAAKISRNACVSPCSFVLAMLYLEQLKTCNPEYLQRVAPSELFLVSLMVSSKFLHDDGEEDEVFVDEWASSGGIAVKALIQLEKEFLNAIQWEIFVPEHTFWKKLAYLETTLAKKEGGTRGWFTYSELQNLLLTVDTVTLVQCLTTVLSILLATYTLGILTLVGSMFLVSNIPGNCLQRSLGAAPSSYLAPEFSTETETSSLENEVSNDSTSHHYKKHMDAADVLKTGILLASLKPTESENNTENEPRSEPWAWWTSPAMDWLTKTSQLIEKLDFFNIQPFSYYRYVDSSYANEKMLNLEDQIHRATKLRLQDQLEGSWHKEWTDTVINIIFKPKLLT